MKLIAHRGWSQGSGENSLAAFARAARDRRVSGVEFDVRSGLDGGALLVTHDATRANAPALTLETVLASLAGTDLELFVEIKQTGIAAPAVETLVAAGVAERSVVFAFADVARSFPWRGGRPVRLGAILPFPWTVQRFIQAYDPDTILLGWDERAWTRAAFRSWHAVFPLHSLVRRCAKPVVVGIVRREADLHWLVRQNVYAAVADMDLIGADPLPHDGLNGDETGSGLAR